MELVDGSLHVAQFFTVTLGIVVLFVGKRVNDLVNAVMIPYFLNHF